MGRGAVREIDSESFYDFQATRPMVSLVDGETRQIDWPENTFLHAPLPGGGRDVILLLGVEPNLRWRTFCTHVAELATSFGVELVITLGSLLADVPHTRPAPVTGSATDPELIEQLGAAGVALRRPDRHRRRAARRVRPRRAQVGEPLGGGAALRLADAVAARREGARRPAGRAARLPTSTPPSSTRPPTRTRSR